VPRECVAKYGCNLQVLTDIEITAGHGISNALGVAGFTNLDVVRNPDLGKAPYLARAIFRYTIPLSDEKVEAERSWLDLRSEAPARRIELIAGKFSLADFFDLNDVGSDSHLQFMNWCDDQNGAWDYAANTRGYTDGAIVQYIAPGWAVRFGSALMPKVANGIYLDADLCGPGITSNSSSTLLCFVIIRRPFDGFPTLITLTWATIAPRSISFGKGWFWLPASRQCSDRDALSTVSALISSRICRTTSADSRAGAGVMGKTSRLPTPRLIAPVNSAATCAATPGSDRSTNSALPAL